MDDESIDARSLLIGLRGPLPARCDFCDAETAPEDLEPEEAGAWVCITCLKRWEEQERKHER